MGILRTGQKTDAVVTISTVKPAKPRTPSATNTASPSLPPRKTSATVDTTSSRPAPAPRLPPRTETNGHCNNGSSTPRPALPARQPSELPRKASDESIKSTISTMTSASNVSTRTSDSGRVRAPAYDPASLPPLPPKRTQEDRDRDQARLPALKASKSTTSVLMSKVRSGSTQYNQQQQQPVAPLPRRPTSSVVSTVETLAAPSPPPRRLPPTDIPALPARRDTTGLTEPAVPPRPVSATGLPTPEATPPPPPPPPIPSATRPDLSKLMATKPRMPSSATDTALAAPSSSAGECLQCRDFSAVDAHAAKFPREQVPSLDWLADRLTAPFPSRTDKARAIFSWLHHNIDYNTVAFFNNAVKPSTPQSTLTTGLAVCEGYAGLFAALATKAGLEAIVVGGHGKGFGYAPVAPGSPAPPPNPTGHAWNAVRLDHGEWKLLDPCWGAGHVNGRNQPYKRSFTSGEFTRSNAQFGRTHFPSNPAHFFLPGGATVSWSEYYLGDVPGGGPAVEVYGDMAPQEGFDKFSFVPRQRQLRAAAMGSGPMRFSFTRVCEHWDPHRHGKGTPYSYVLATAVAEGGKAKEMLQFNTDGFHWWLDLQDAQHRLGNNGDKVFVYAVTSVGGQDARGIAWSEQLFYQGVGWNGVAMWEVV